MLWSTPLLSGLQPVHPPSSAEPHHWQAGRRGWEHQGELGLRVGLYGFVGRETSCLRAIVSSLNSCSTSCTMGLYSSEHPNRYVQDGRYWGGRSWSRTESWEGSWDSRLAGITRDGKCHLFTKTLKHSSWYHFFFRNPTLIWRLHGSVD